MKKILISVALIIFLVSLFALSSCQDPSPSEIKVTFDLNNGTGVNDSVIIEAGATVEEWPRLKREGYSFDGWYLGDEKISLEDFVPEKDVTLVAKWTRCDYSITYVVGEGENHPDNPDGYNWDSVIKLKAPTPNDSKNMFVGWYTDEYRVRTISEINRRSGNLTLYAKYIPYDEALEFIEKDGYYSVKRKDATLSHVEIPSAYNGLPVTEIESEGFKNSSRLKSITLPDCIKVIGNDAFKGCEYLKEITIPDGVSRIGSFAFSSCYSLETVNFQGEVSEIAGYVFYECRLLKEISIPRGVTVINDRSFYGCSGLETVKLSESVSEISEDAFGGCHALKELIVDEDNQALKSVDGVVYSKDGTVLALYLLGNEREEFTVPSGVAVISDGAFKNAIRLKSITLPDTLTSIGMNAFKGCYAVEKISVPYGVTKIGYAAFCECSSLKTVTLPKGIDKVEKYTFYRCYSLEEIVVPEGVKIIDSSAFYECKRLRTVTIPDSVDTIEGRAFSDCTSLEVIELGAKINSLELSAFVNCSSLQKITVDEGNQAYKSVDGVLYSKDGTEIIKCPAAKKDSVLSIPNGVTKIGTDAFYQCTGIRSVTVPASLVSISSDSFDGFTSLEEINVDGENPVAMSVDGVLYSKDGKTLVRYPCGKKDSAFTIPEGVTEIGAYAFRRCSNVKSVIISEDVVSIGTYAFEYCTSIESLTVPSTVQKMGQGAFRRCDGLESVVFSEGLSIIGDSAFTQCKKLKAITVPGSVKEIGTAAFSYCGSLESVVISDGVETIGKSAFSYCEKLSSVALPDSITTLSSYAFSNCSSLRNIDIPRSVTSIEEGAFYKCSALESILIPISVKKMDVRAVGFNSNLTIYCEAEAKPEGWHEKWATGSKAVVWGHAEDGEQR